MATHNESPHAEMLEIALRSTDREVAERALAFAYAAGAVGCEERDEDGGVTFLLYAPAAVAESVWRTAVEVAGAGAQVSAPRALRVQDWSDAWKALQAPIVLSPRLLVRPSFAVLGPEPGQQVLVVDPAQAFGTGSHESTRLALEWLDACAPALPRDGRVLDLGTGTGILALAALALAHVTAFGLDLDPLAAREARSNALRNGLAARLRVWCGGIESIAPAARFDLVVANLLRRELEPVLEGIALRTRPAGLLVLSGLLREERQRVEERAQAAGLAPVGVRERVDASGACWIALLMRR
jgi:ribosomal protein L11 methyltransferase